MDMNSEQVMYEGRKDVIRCQIYSKNRRGKNGFKEFFPVATNECLLVWAIKEFLSFESTLFV